MERVVPDTARLDRPRIPALLTLLDRVFPPNAGAYMSDDQQTAHELVKASSSMGEYLAELGEARARDLDVLDYGCGWGGETMWLARRVRTATGVDVDPDSIRQAQQAAAAIHNCRFAWSADGRLPFEAASFDAVFSTDTFEHVMDLDLAFGEIARVLRPGGSLLTRFGPLFHSPLGYHLYWACQVPYAHLLFGLDAIAALRASRGGSTERPASWQSLGLNAKRFDDFKASAARSGLQLVRFDPIPVKGLTVMTVIPKVKDFFIFGVDCHLTRPR
jgi:SAM-dependent methyltransferase